MIHPGVAKRRMKRNSHTSMTGWTEPGGTHANSRVGGSCTSKTRVCARAHQARWYRSFIGVQTEDKGEGVQRDYVLAYHGVSVCSRRYILESSKCAHMSLPPLSSLLSVFPQTSKRHLCGSLPAEAGEHSRGDGIRPITQTFRGN